MLYLVIGPPAAGKSTWCRSQAGPDDIVIDFDRLAQALSVRDDAAGHDHPDALKKVTKAARRAAIDTAVGLAGMVDVYVIHSTPSPRLVADYRRKGAKVVVVDPGRDVVMARAKAERPWWMQQVVKRWYEAPTRVPGSATVQQSDQHTTSNALAW
ncbi:AAA family ATPase [Nocardia cyriacigeorgica]|uniref:AAA family ATPase n=1 Tax=Nocardia cyriacigeorgica TaxID=135487 RepID=UPI0013D46183|nr:AAA family ATPase [Nocardia cyriacigeorgica]NEW27257.1 hypothetical protein [Nocardia cyriacigeorgica]